MTNAHRMYTANLILQNFSKSSGYVHVVKMRCSFDGTLQALPFSSSFPVDLNSPHVLLHTVRFRATASTKGIVGNPRTFLLSCTRIEIVPNLFLGYWNFGRFVERTRSLDGEEGKKVRVGGIAENSERKWPCPRFHCVRGVRSTGQSRFQALHHVITFGLPVLCVFEVSQITGFRGNVNIPFQDCGLMQIRPRANRNLLNASNLSRGTRAISGTSIFS
jgi:hypothetical protein